jgi:hypothetical protein
VAETEGPSVSELRADQLEFLRQLFKVTERLDSGGLLLKNVFGDNGDSEITPKATGLENFEKL